MYSYKCITYSCRIPSTSQLTHSDIIFICKQTICICTNTSSCAFNTCLELTIDSYKIKLPAESRLAVLSAPGLNTSKRQYLLNREELYNARIPRSTVGFVNCMPVKWSFLLFCQSPPQYNYDAVLSEVAPTILSTHLLTSLYSFISKTIYPRMCCGVRRYKCHISARFT